MSETADSVKPDSTQDKADVSKRFFALYSLQPQRKCPSLEGSEGETEQRSNQSLTVIATNLSAPAEVDLRKSILSWLEKDTIAPGKGKFSSLGLNLEIESSSSAICYSSIIESADPLAFDDITSGETSSLSSDTQQFVVSFLSFQDSSLDLFRQEFEQYVKGLVPLLDKELFVACADPSTRSENESTNNSATTGGTFVSADLSQLGVGIQAYLEQWPTSVLGYLTRAVDLAGPDVEFLIYAALLNASLQINGAMSEQEEDIKRFVQCCSLSPLLDQLQSPDSSDPRSITASSDSADLWQLQAPIVALTLREQGQGDGEGEGRLGRLKVEPANSCSFCKSAAEKLMTLDSSNVTKIRDFLESIKLAFVHNLNKLKRYLKQAELDYYALYSSLSYLKKSGCGELLLQYVKLDAGPDTLSLMNSLETFVADTKMTLT